MHFIHILFDENVKVLEEQNNFTIFDLIVQIGSSLGLYVGLSAMAIFDLISIQGRKLMSYKSKLNDNVILQPDDEQDDTNTDTNETRDATLSVADSLHSEMKSIENNASISTDIEDIENNLKQGHWKLIKKYRFSQAQFKLLL